MIYIIDTIPNFCPGCGKDLSVSWKNTYAREDFYAQASHSCNCGARFQFVSGLLITKLAKESGGDMAETS